MAIFDLDDTLVYTSWTFNQPALEACRELTLALGVKAPHVLDIIQKQVQINITTLERCHEDRFAQSWVEAYEHFAAEQGVAPNDDCRRRIFEAAMTYRSTPVALVPHALDCLRRCRQQGHEVHILTQGDEEGQMRKVTETGIDRVVSPDRIRIVPMKSAEVLRAMVGNQEAAMIGNSLRSDILPAVETGIFAFHISAATWGFDNVSEENRSKIGRYPKYRMLQSLGEVPQALEEATRSQTAAG